MPDISMCDNKSCPLKENCYRFKAVPNPNRQSYMEFKHKDGKCLDFYQVQKGHRIITIKT
jgi:hypothetical protein